MTLKRLFPVFLAAAVILTVFTGCEGFVTGGGGDTTTTQATEPVAVETTTEEATEAMTEATTEEQKGTYIDIGKLRVIAAQSSCPVKVEGVRTIKNYYTDKYVLYSRDVIAFTVKNESDKTIKEIKIRFCTYDSDYCQVDSGAQFGGYGLSGNRTQDYTWNTLEAGSEYDAEALEIAPGETKELTIKTNNADAVFGVEAIVVSYKTDSGKTVENPKAQEWKIECNGKDTDHYVVQNT